MLRAQSKTALLPLLAAVLASQPLGAATVADLYVAEVPVEALSGPPLDEAFALALDQVLVKVTGQRGIAADPARRRAVGSPGPLVRQYQPMPGGQLRVSFDPAALRRRLDAANLPVWSDDRPRTLVVLPPEPSAGPGVPNRQLVESTAASRGIPVTFGSVPSGTAGVLLTAQPAPTGGPAMLRWTLAWDDLRAEWQGDAAEGAHGLADRLAARYATAASAGSVLRLRIAGVDSFDAYGRLQAYLRGVGLIQSAELKQVYGGEFVYELAVRGDEGQLNDAFALRRVLEPVPGAGPGDARYRLVAGGLPPGAEGS